MVVAFFAGVVTGGLIAIAVGWKLTAWKNDVLSDEFEIVMGDDRVKGDAVLWI